MDDNSVIVKRKQIHYKHDTIVYVPVFQEDFDKDGNLNSSSTFVYSFRDADSDLQMVASLKPDYILTLTGKFDAITKPLIIKGDE